jgi:pyruvate/2-oxoglutarate dehydrogenase complex dihydrolipoamide dehydrogenase (E3) component
MEMQVKEYDAIWYGGGASGRFGAAFQKALGGNPLIIEAHSLGGECHRCRCAFENYIADQASMANLMRLYSGVSWYPEIDLSKISMGRALESFRKVGHKAFAELMAYQTEQQLGVDVVYGEGRIVDKNTVEVDGKVYKAKSLVIANGSRPTVPNIPGVKLPGVMTYLDHPYVEIDPKRLVVIGGGNIGVGKAAMFRAFNIEVTILEKYRVLGDWDGDTRDFVIRQLQMQGINIVEGVDVREIKGEGKVEVVVGEVDGQVVEYACDAVMVSVGLTPNSEAAMPLGVKIGKNNEIVIDEKCQTSVPGVYAVGDVAGRPYLMSISRKRGMVAAKTMQGIDAKMNYSCLPAHVYLPPLEATSVGMTEEEARKNHEVAIVKYPIGPRPENVGPEEYAPGFSGHALPLCGRMMTLDILFYGQDRHGFLKAIVDTKTRKFLGFHHVGDGAKTAFQYLSYLLQIGWTVDQMADLHEIFLNAEHFIQLTRLVAGYEDLSGLSRLGEAAQ